MDAGVELLLKRMNSNPEEFADGERWDDLLRELFGRDTNFICGVEVNPYTDEERKAIRDKLGELYKQDAHKELMAKLLKEEKRPKKGTGGSTSMKDIFAKQLKIETKRHQMQLDLNKYALTKQQLEIAKKMNVPADEYVRQIERLRDEME